MKRFILILTGILALCKIPGQALPTPLAVYAPPSVVISSQPTAANVAATVTITTPTAIGPYSAGNYTYITKIYVVAHATATIVGTASPVTCTVTGVTNSPKFFLPTALTVGQEYPVDLNFHNPLQSVIGSNVVVSCPASGSLLYLLNVNYYQGQ